MVDIRMIAEALQDAAGDDLTFYWNRRTETIVMEDEIEDFEDEDLVMLPDRYEINSYSIMERFIAQVDNPTAQEWLSNSIRGKGAFRRFRSTCERFGLTNQWYDFEEKYYLELAKNWCAENEVAFEEYKNPMVSDEDDLEEDWVEEDEPNTVEDIVRLTMATHRNRQSLLWMMEEYLTEFGLTEESNAQDLLDYYAENLDSIYFASKQGRPCGFMVVDGTILGELLLLYVRKENRRQGIGSSLLHWALDEDEDLKVYIEPDNEEAKAFFAANGYDTIKRVQLIRRTRIG